MHDAPPPGTPPGICIYFFLGDLSLPTSGGPDRPHIRCFEYNLKGAKLISLQ